MSRFDLNLLDPLIVPTAKAQFVLSEQKNYVKHAPDPVKAAYEPYKGDPAFAYYARTGKNPLSEITSYVGTVTINGEPHTWEISYNTKCYEMVFTCVIKEIPLVDNRPTEDCGLQTEDCGL